MHEVQREPSPGVPCLNTKLTLKKGLDRKMYIGGLDIGTTGCKIVLYSKDGKLVKTAYREYNVKRQQGLSEVDIEAVTQAVFEVFKEVSDCKIEAVGVTSFGETFVMLDENNTPLCPSMLYTDPRGIEEKAQLEEKFTRESLAVKTGTIPHEMYSICKLLWVKKHMSKAVDKAKHILLMQDYIVYTLTGVAQIDYSLAARTGAFDVRNKCWIKQVFDFCGIDTSLMSKPVQSGSVAGTIKSELAKELGLNSDMVVVTGAQDQIAALVGAGVYETGTAMDGIGTVECVPIVMDKVPDDFEIYKGGYSVVSHVNGKYACYILSYAGGATLKWFRDNISKKPYAELDNDVKNEPTDLLIMPHFAGAATPYMDSSSKAAVVGLTFEHTASDIYKALMEGTSYEILLNLMEMQRIGIKLSEVTATGGGARSDVWLQIKADVFGIPVKGLEQGEIGAAGTALMAGKAVGVFNEDTKLIDGRKTFYPDMEKHAYYLKQYEKYKKIYNAVKEINS